MDRIHAFMEQLMLYSYSDFLVLDFIRSKMIYAFFFFFFFPS